LERQVRRTRVERAEGGELLGQTVGAELVEPLARRQVLQAMLAEVDDGDGPEQVAGRLRADDLAAMRGRGDARRPVDVHTCVL
jgi:hypothetical protein